MKNLFLSLFCIGFGLVQAQVNITFQVDMSYYEKFDTARGVYVAGDAAPLKWSPFLKMSDPDGDSIYEVTVNGITKSNFDYKFINASSWTGSFDEKMSDAACKGSGTNRKVIIDSAATDTVLSFMFGSCDPAGTLLVPPVDVMVAFTVDVAYKVKTFGVGFTKVYVSGEFNEWAADTTSLEANGWMLTKTGEYTYEGTFKIKGNKDYLYKVLFNNGSATAKYEQTSNRILHLSASDTTLGLCFENTEYPCPVPPDPSNVTFRVDMPDTLMGMNQQVFVVGTFRETTWEYNPIAMDDADGDGVYEVTIEDIAPGTFQYRFAYGTPDSLNMEFEGMPVDTVLSACHISVNDLGDGLNRTYTRQDHAHVVLSIQPWEGCDATGIADYSEIERHIRIHPNPFTDFAIVTFENTDNSSYSISIADLTGKIVMQNTTNANTCNIQRGQLKNGFYLLVVEGNHRRTVKKLIIK